MTLDKPRLHRLQARRVGEAADVTAEDGWSIIDHAVKAGLETSVH
jgi:AraC-like DNA-binding protein